MSRLNKIIEAKVPLWFLLLIYGITIWAGAFFLFYHTHFSTVYEFTLPGIEGEHYIFEHGPLPALQNREYFNNVKEYLIEGRTSFIMANLETMEMEVYQDGQLLYEFPIAAKGAEGSFTETPAGLYSVQWKTRNHLSSLYNVYMPYSIQFHGNYFIHGWSYHPGGRPVASETSAGCIRLDTENAETLFNFAQPGMPVLVFEQGFDRDDFAYFSSPDNVSASHYIGMDIKSDFIFFEDKMEETVEVTNLTNLLTALIASEQLFLGGRVSISENVENTDTYIPRFSSGQSTTVFTLLATLLNESSLQASAALTERIGQTTLKTLVDQHLNSLGMNDTSISNTPEGERNVSTARDMMTLSKYLYFNRSSILEISRGEFGSVYLNIPFSLEPIHGLHSDPDFVGGFISHNGQHPGSSMLAIYEIEVRGTTRPVALFVAGSSSPIEDIQSMIRTIRLEP